ncbi:putative phosphohydrolase [Caldicoprobacter guelmensis]|uniref:metallophosphoesterase n=1 Tax=Caldicoprobacter guelmensis TaxID=1170224 RepID=UPI00195F1006|nr:metallophosphoesterase [Caldicoprobacter guelmensis]MBM7582042.1 putative phosphohydrolase [Caldicoprobacter guelmensis]
MKVFAIGDLHLSEANPKPMDVFGEHWFQHWERIKYNWISKVGPEDVVLIPGDISWAMKLEEAKPDLESIGQLPGRKIIIRGNHDYWWSSISKVRKMLPDNMFAIQNDSIFFEGIAFCGTRGWTVLEAREDVQHDIKIFNRELNRLKLSLDSAKGAREIVVMLHYPPFDERGNENDMAKLIRQYPVKHVVFGHLHGASLSSAVEGYMDGVTYHLVSCDYLNFDLKLIMEG